MARVTTTFSPDPTCFAPSNLWLMTWAPGYQGCNTYYTPFSSRPTEIVTATDCGVVQLGRPGGYDDPCNQYNWLSTGDAIYSETGYSACPEGFTGAETSTLSWDNGVVIVRTACCPTAYDFTPAGPIPTAHPQEIDGTTYPVTHSTMNAYCKANSIKELSDQTVTMTVSASPTPTTTEVAWDYDNDFIVVTPAMISKFLYTNPRASTTSTCFGEQCIMNSNPLQPIPTTHRGSYKPPPSAAVTQLTPSPSCLAATNLWLVSDRCNLVAPAITQSTPSWLQCTHTVAGDPDGTNPSCYQGPSRSTLINNTPTYYTACPSGYTAANTRTTKPFDDRTFTWSVDATTINCCPASFNSPPLSFNHTSPSWFSTTVHSGTTHTVSAGSLPPYCVASHLPSELHEQPVTLSFYSLGTNSEPGRTYEGSSEMEWDTGLHTVYAHPQTVMWTVFHGTYTCFEKCSEYWRYSYYNTRAPGEAEETGSTTTSAEGGGGDGNGGSGSGNGDGNGGAQETSVSVAGAAVGGYYGRAGEAVGQAGVVMVVVTVVNVVVGALV